MQANNIVTFPGARVRRRAGGLAWKRPMDMLLVALMLPVLLPVFAVIALLVKADSRGPVFFVQERVGLDGRRFRMVKFRSMHRDAEARRAALLATSDREGVCFKVREDPRVTRVGRFLRRSSLDELPQLLNVLRGDMSLVGPRPALPEEVAAYPDRAMERLHVPPGLTGLWQVSGRAEVPFERMIDMDVSYVRTASPALDLRILAATVGVVISGRGAY